MPPAAQSPNVAARRAEKAAERGSSHQRIDAVYVVRVLVVPATPLWGPWEAQEAILDALGEDADGATFSVLDAREVSLEDAPDV